MARNKVHPLEEHYRHEYSDDPGQNALVRDMCAWLDIAPLDSPDMYYVFEVATWSSHLHDWFAANQLTVITGPPKYEIVGQWPLSEEALSDALARRGIVAIVTGVKVGH